MRRQVTRTSHDDSHFRLWMTMGRSVLAKSAKMTWRSKWTSRLEKLSEKALWALSSRNRREKGAKSKDEEASEWRGFWAGIDLRLGAIDTTNINKKERERERNNQKSPQTVHNSKNMWKEIHMHGECMNMWHAKKIASWAQLNPNLSAHKQFAHT